MKLNINEIFIGIQGEGLYQGKNSLFIRFNGCNLKCKICDTKKTWSGEDSLELKDVKKNVDNNSHIVITGGEPLLYQDEIIGLFTKQDYKKFYEIETNGTILLECNGQRFTQGDKILFNISPKQNIERLDDENDEPILIDQLKKLGINYIVKFLLKNKEDFVYADEIVREYEIPDYKVFIQPLATTEEEIRNIVSKYYFDILKRGWSISFRLHTIFNLK